MPLTLPSVNLTALSSQVNASVTNLTSLGGQLASQATGAINAAIPAIGALQNTLGSAVSSLSGAAASIGTAISGASVAALPNMAKVVAGLVPDLTGLKTAVSGALSAVTNSLIPLPAALTSVITAIGAQTQSIQESITQVLASITTDTQGANSEYADMLSEIILVEGSMAAYDEAMAAYVFDPVNNTIPDLPTELATDRLTAVARNSKDSAVDLVAGTISSTVYKAASIARELGARLATKAMLYDRAIATSADSGTESIANAGRLASQLRSSSPEQSEGV